MLELFKKLAGDKKEYRDMMERAKALPEDYQFVYDKMQKYMWSYAAGDGYDMLKILYGLIELFEQGAADGKHVLEVTGEDVVAFCDELLRDARMWTDDMRDKLNRDIMKKLGKEGASK